MPSDASQGSEGLNQGMMVEDPDATIRADPAPQLPPDLEPLPLQVRERMLGGNRPTPPTAVDRQAQVQQAQLYGAELYEVEQDAQRARGSPRRPPTRFLRSLILGIRKKVSAKRRRGRLESNTIGYLKGIPRNPRRIGPTGATPRGRNPGQIRSLGVPGRSAAETNVGAVRNSTKLLG